MIYPPFFDDIEPIILQDELSKFLGASQEGILQFSYVEIVKSAGHSCPTVLGAFLMTQAGLNALYENDLPKRGEIQVAFKEEMNDGVTGVISNVVKNITGATALEGFKGIAGNFDRRYLLSFNQNIESSMRLTRRDTKQSVDVFYDASLVPASMQLQEMMKKCIAKEATKEEQLLFGKLWQERVENIYKRKEKVVRVELVKA